MNLVLNMVALIVIPYVAVAVCDTFTSGLFAGMVVILTMRAVDQIT